MKRFAAAAVLLSLVAAPSTVSSSAASADVLKLACTPSQIRIQVFSEMKGTKFALPNVILFTNTKGSCFLPRHNIPVQPEKATSLIRRNAGPVSPVLSLPGLVTLAHGASVRSTIQWTAPPPKGWTNSSCPPSEITGVDVGGPTSAWTMKFHRWPATFAFCAAFTVKLSSSIIRLGS